MRRFSRPTVILLEALSSSIHFKILLACPVNCGSCFLVSLVTSTGNEQIDDQLLVFSVLGASCALKKVFLAAAFRLTIAEDPP